MPRLREFISVYDPPRSVALPAVSRVEESYGEISKMHEFVAAMGEQITSFDASALYQEIISAWVNGNDLRFLSLRTLKRSPLVFFRSGLGEMGVLASHRNLLNNYKEWLLKSKNIAAVATLFEEYLYNYDEMANWLPFAQEVLRELFDRLPLGRLQHLKALCQQHHYLEPLAHKKFLDVFNDDTVDACEHALSAGLKGRVSDHGFAKYVYIELLSMINLKLRDKSVSVTTLSGLIAWSLLDNGKLRFPEFPGLLQNKLLEPFATRDDLLDARNLIFPFLLKQFGDPHSQLNKWAHATSVSRKAMSRWMAHSSLKTFFQLLEHACSQNPSADRMWTFRKAFWEAYLKNNAIKEAWVILGTEASRIAQGDYNLKKGQFGQLIMKDGVEPLHSVLLMKIGNLTIAEWSHNGKCHLWQEGEALCPEFYKATYSRNDLRNEREGSGANDPPFSHYRSDRYRWQVRISAYISEKTKILVPMNEFVPR